MEESNAQDRPSRVSSARTWKKQPSTTELELPSGNVALVRKITVEEILSRGLLPDTLAPIADKVIKESSRSGRPAKSADQLEGVEFSLASAPALLELLDRVVCAAVVQPPVALAPKCARCGAGEYEHARLSPDHQLDSPPRDPDVLYIDEVDYADKEAVFDFVLGDTANLERFRRQPSRAVGDLPARQDVELPAVAPTGHR